MRKIVLTCLSISFQILANTFQLNAQCSDCHEGKHDNYAVAHSSSKPDLLPPDSSGGLAKSYLLQNVCGLNYTQASVRVTTRYTPMPGTGLPCTVPLALNSCNTDSVVKAFLYFSGSYFTGYAANPASVTITNPAALVYTYAADSIGTGPPKCWGETGSIAYRQDVTNCISSGGNYIVNLSGTGINAQSIDGITLLVIYLDKSASYSGSIVLYDGLWVSNGGAHSQTFSGFNVCNATPNAQAFAVLEDMQSNVSTYNTETFNGTTITDSNLFYNFCNVATPLTALQASTTYSVYTNNGGDCYSWTMAGLYWQNTSCMTCNPSIAGITVSANSTPATCANNGSANAVVTGASSPLTYSWAPGGQTTDTATSLYAGTYTVYVSDSSTCALAVVTVGNNTMVLSTSSTVVNCAYPGTATVSITNGFPPYTYVWSPGGQTTDSITGLTGGSYTVIVTDSIGCMERDSVTVTRDMLSCSAFGTTTILAGDSAYIYATCNIPSLVTSWSWAPSNSVTYPDSSHTYVHPTTTTTYTVTDSTFCGSIRKTITITVNGILGVNNIANAISNLSIYPNPSNGQMTLEWSVVSGQSSVRISIYDELGQAVYDDTETQVAGKNQKQINLESLASGIYTLRMQSSGDSVVKKVVIMKKS